MKHIKLVLITFFIAVGVFAVVKYTFAFLPFGGFVKNQIFCNNGILLFVGPPRGGLFMLSPGAVIFPFHSPYTGHWVLGNASFGGACIITHPDSPPTIIPAFGTIRIVGSS